jgi:hypothetical protein
MARTDILYQAIHPLTGAYYTFSPLGPSGQELAAPFSRRTATAQQPGYNGEIDLLGSRAAAANKRQCSCSFTVPYDGSFITAAGVAITNFTEAYDELIRQCGHGRPQKFIKKTGQTPTQFRWCYARVYDIPEKSDNEAMGAAQFTIHFEMVKPFWKGDPAGWHLWDDPNDPLLNWDNASLFWDDDPNTFMLTAAANSHTIQNPGTVEAEEVRIEIHGPMPGPIFLSNFAVEIRPGQYMYFSWAESLLAGDVLVVDTGLGIVQKNHANAFDGRFGVPLGQGKWFWLVPGANPLQVTSGGTGTFNGQAIITADPPYA